MIIGREILHDSQNDKPLMAFEEANCLLAPSYCSLLSCRRIVLGLPFVTQDRHFHQVGVLAIDPYDLARATFFHKTAGQVAADRRFAGEH